ncbi:uncharacterized protein LOC129963033 [Argiope bruennichi]|uniref:uncharacterized protein LOC129963033 n=1 Tax=Argiope bruennichi TaxID=94029 RepID=UPI0024950EE7|nr:uncharacterized protein LOC129963033 [Argiope bruennichi]
MVRNTESGMLMIKQLEIQISLELARNSARPMKLIDLALYINALLLTCKNPTNFYGDNLVHMLRNAVDNAQREDTFINPSVYLTLCTNNATTYDDAKKLQDIFLSQNDTISRIDMQALGLLTASCMFRKTNFLNATLYDNIKMEFLRNLKIHGFPGNVYEAALLAQALQEVKVSLRGSTDFILRQQESDGSFGGILATYLALPVLAGRNLIPMNKHCGQQIISDLIPLEVLKNVKRKKMHVQYSLNYGYPPEVTQTIQMHVAEGTNLLDLMRLAQEINSKYRFKLSENRKVPVVFSIGDMPNDVEKGMYWMPYKAVENGSEITNDKHWVPYTGDIKKLILANGDKVLFWYRPL